MNLTKNFLKKDEFQKIESVIMGEKFPWYFSGVVASRNDDENFYFVHWFYNIGEAGESR